jgi:hypothetical protein
MRVTCAECPRPKAQTGIKALDMTPCRHFVEQSSYLFSVVSALAGGVAEDDDLGFATRHPGHYLSAKHCGL